MQGIHIDLLLSVSAVFFSTKLWTFWGSKNQQNPCPVTDATMAPSAFKTKRSVCCEPSWLFGYSAIPHQLGGIQVGYPHSLRLTFWRTWMVGRRDNILSSSVSGPIYFSVPLEGLSKFYYSMYVAMILHTISHKRYPFGQPMSGTRNTKQLPGQPLEVWKL